MRAYIVNLTNQLIGEHRFDELAKKTEHETLYHMAKVLRFEDIGDMKPETLGKIMCAFETGDVMTDHPGKEVRFGGDTEDMLRELVALCLAYAIHERLKPENQRPSGIPGYKR